MVLYWDEVGAIVPYDFIQDPDRLDQRMVSLVRENLVTQVIPGMYLHGCSRFTASFVEYLEALGPELTTRRRQFRTECSTGRASRIHLEKLQDAMGQLQSMGLASRKGNAWCLVQSTTARDFMAYLASVLGKNSDLGFTPATDDARHLEGFISASKPEASGDHGLAALRLDVLERSLPAPEQALDASAIRRFKDHHGAALVRFRRRVEQEVLALAGISDTSLRARRLALFQDEASDEIAAIRARMESAGWGRVLLTRLCSVVSAIPEPTGLVGLAAAVIGAFGPTSVDLSSSPFLYAAMAERDLSA
jgi:hypothetical protein